jgi:RNA polymerase sigma-70 factor (ECF subfamily)
MDELDRMFRTYHDSLVRYLTRRTGDVDVAEELAQETFIRALKHVPLASERSWLFAVATNLLRDEGRKRTRRQRHLELWRDEQDIAAPAEADDDSDREVRASLARRAVQALPERDRQALLLKEEGLDYFEIAAAMELSVGSVGTTLSRARRRLVEIYERLQRDDAADSRASQERERGE